MRIVERIAASALGLVLVLGLFGAVYNQFSPGGALSGSWNSQNVNVGAGGSFITGTLPAGNGGTGQTAATDDTTLIGNGTVFEAKAVPNCTDTTGNHLNYLTATNSFVCGTSAVVGQSVQNITANFTTGFTVAQTQNLTILKTGNTYTVHATGTISGTSNSTDFLSTTLALSGIAPVTDAVTVFNIAGTDNGAAKELCVRLETSGAIRYGLPDATRNCVTNTFQNTGTKGASAGWRATYSAIN